MNANVWSLETGPAIDVASLLESLEVREERRAFEKLFHGRRYLRPEPHVTGIEMVAWLHRKELQSDFWVRPPFDDHARAISSSEGRSVFLMPYQGAVRKELGLPVGVGKKLLLEMAFRTSRKFAKKHGLTVQIFDEPGWHGSQTFLIEYRKRISQLQ